MPIADNITSLSFTYTMNDGTVTSSPANPANIRKVNISVTARTSFPDHSGAYRTHYPDDGCHPSQSGFIIKGGNMNSTPWRMKVSVLKDERGAALITGLLLVLVLTILSMAAMMSTATELKIAANDRSAKQVFYAAEAGLEDARSRLQTAASASPITDSPANPSWKAFVGTSTKAALMGYDSGSSDHSLFTRLDGSLDYATKVEYKLDGSGNILKWGDTDGDGVSEENTSLGNNIYVITSEGYGPNGASKPVKIEATKTPWIHGACRSLHERAHHGSGELGFRPGNGPLREQPRARSPDHGGCEREW